jgi:predicted XRE-type DNA-binding protein
MNPYDIDYTKLKESKKITENKEILKLQLASIFVDKIEGLETSEVLKRTGLDKSDLSRIMTTNVSRFSLERLIGLLNKLGYTAKISVAK